MRRNLQCKISVLLLLLGLSVQPLLAQERTVSGKVTAQEDGNAIPGVNVVLKGTAVGAATDAQGKYSLSVPASGGTLVFSFIGLQSREVEIGDKTIVDVSLAIDATELGEVIVVGYGTTLKKELSGAIATVSGKELERLPSLSLSQSLQGQAAGVMVTQNSGAPGGGVSVRVRGQSSISASNDPLYVVDGVPIFSGDLTVNALGGQRQSALATLNPQDIASIEVLKDASAAAIYGSRAANGVVIITTKRGQSGATRINFNAWTGWGTATNTPETITAEEWVAIKNEARVNDGLAPASNATLGWDGVTNTNWIKEVFRTARTNEYQLNVSGGDAKTTYYASGSYREEEGTMLGSKYSRFTGRLNLDHKASSFFSFGAGLTAGADENHRIFNDNNIWGIYSASILTPPTKRIRNEEGEFVDALPSFNTNPVRDALNARNLNKTLKLIGSAYVNFELLKGLNFRTDISYDMNTITEDQHYPSSHPNGRPSGSGTFSFRNIGSLNIEPTLRYSKVIAANHNLSAVLGSTLLQTREFRSTVTGNNFARESLTYLVSAATITAGSSFRTDYALASFFARANYAFKEKYVASATIRRDGSSRFGPNNKYATFYAVSAGWNFADESFMDGLGWLDLGKLRASYGTTGNDGTLISGTSFRFDNFPWQGTWSGNGNYLNRSAFVPVQIANPDLKWETTTTTDIGLELAMFNNKVSINTGYYIKRTADLLYGSPLALTTGFSSLTKNIGEIENKGYEFDMKVVALDNKGLKITLGGNATFMRNKVVKLLNDEPIISGFSSAVIVGRSINSFYGLNYIGVDPGTGDAVFEDTNRDGVITAADNTYLGTAMPNMVGGFTTNISYKGLSLDVFFNFVHDVKIYNATMQFSTDPSNPFGMTSEMRRRWRNPGDITDIPRATLAPGLATSEGSRYLSSGDYLRMKNITLSYEIPAAWAAKVKMRTARIYVNGQNLLTFTKYPGADPEVSTFANTSTAAGTDFLTQPQTKMYSVGLNLGF